MNIGYPLVILSMIIWGSTGISSLIFLPVIKHMKRFDPMSLILMIILSVIHTCIALNLYFEGIKRIKVQHVGVLFYIDHWEQLYWEDYFSMKYQELQQL
jgi:EamA domain-containing membrane protein RarD